MTDFRAYRSVLYLPAANARAIAKARTLAADAVILDLEDAVAPDAKPAARAAAVEALQTGEWRPHSRAIRVNAIGTSWCAEDFAAAAGVRPDAIVVPKVSSAAEAAEAVRLADGVPVWAMIETPRGVQAVDAIADMPGVTALLVGAADLEKDVRCYPGADRAELQYALQRIVIAARAAGIMAFDAMHPEIGDTAGLEALCRQGKALGFDGKTLIHPSQVDMANSVFSPSDEEVAQARRIVEAFETAQAEGRGITTLGSKMVEALHVAQAQQLLAFADRIKST